MTINHLWNRDKRATETEKQKGDLKRRMLNTAISSFMLRRTKNEFADILNLTSKSEKAVFCNLSPLQKDIYKHVLNLSDFLALKNANIPCDCGENTLERKFSFSFSKLSIIFFVMQYFLTDRNKQSIFFKLPIDQKSSGANKVLSKAQTVHYTS